MLSLLQKELIEHAANKRNYIIKFCYGLCLYSCFLLLWNKMQGHTFETLGNGHSLVHSIEILNFIVVCIVLPFTSSHLIAAEKEKGTLPLLMISRVSSYSLLLQKYASVVLITISFLTISLPVFFLSILLGGVTISSILSYCYYQLLMVLQIAAIGLMCSCYCSRCVSAAIATYSTLFTLYISMFVVQAFYNISFYTQFYFIPMRRLYLKDFASQVEHSLPIGVTIFVSLILAYVFFDVKTKRNRKKNAKCMLSPPQSDAIYWREAQKHFSLATNTMLFAVLAGIIFLAAYQAPRHEKQTEIVAVLFFPVATFISIWVIVKSASLFHQEYKKQTLQVMLSTTMQDREILLQKQKPIDYFCYSVYFFAFLIGCNFAFIGFANPFREIEPEILVIYFTVFVVIATQSLKWLSLSLGIRFYRSSWLPVVVMAIVATGVILPVVLSRILEMEWIAFISPYYAVDTLIAQRVSYDIATNEKLYFSLLVQGGIGGVLFVCYCYFYRNCCLREIDCN